MRLAGEEDDEVQALVVHPGEGVGGVHADGAHDRQDLLFEVGPDPLLLGGGPAPAAQETDPLAFQRGEHFVVEQTVLVADQRVGDGADPRQHFGRAQVVRTRLHGSVAHLLHEAAHPHLEELVQVRARDAQEAQALEHGGVRVARLLEHSAVEREQAQLAVDVEVGLSRFGASMAASTGAFALAPEAGMALISRVRLDNYGASRVSRPLTPIKDASVRIPPSVTGEAGGFPLIKGMTGTDDWKWRWKKN